MPARPRTAPEPAPSETVVPVPAPSGGDEVVQMDNIAPGATGVGVARGKPSSGRIGRGGSGGGTGAGSGAGAGDEIGKPVSIATIKTRAMPKREFDLLELGRNYPAEAKALGIEGDLRVRLIVDERGQVKSRVLLNKLGHGLDEVAMQHAAELEFEPARDTDDRPVTSVVVWTFHMNLPR
jgi:TonB family protein